MTDEGSEIFRHSPQNDVFGVLEAFLKKNILFYAFILSGLTFFVSQTEAATIRISAPKVQLELVPGETYSGEIVAENPTTEAVKVKIYLEDWAYTPGAAGQKTFTPVGSTSLSCGKWITFSPSDTTIEPFGRLQLRYTIKVPPDAKGGHYAVLFFETILGAATDEEGVNVLVAGRIGSLFYIEAKGVAERKGKIESVNIKAPEGNKPFEIVTTFANTGDVDITLNGKYLIMDKDGVVHGRGDLSSIYTFPGYKETEVTQWVGRLPKGDYQVLLTYDLGKGKTLVEEKTLTIT